ncbi:TRM11 family SAM-dependent methyltransferase [Fontibacillus sp. BL9]|uniref:TRM11 family SAM-dependent methyltransferase n=1 Tax=Fontibacillus sp. BL9 TaxID=3389971 RepID=UPI00397C32E2
MRVDVLFTGHSLEEIITYAAGIKLEGSTFKVLYLKNGLKRSYEEQRQLERRIGAHIRGTAKMRHPDITFGLLSYNGGWMFGICRQADPVWQQHKHKPRNYSTGLPVAMARALVNIGIPDPKGIRAIDPCCGMGNVLIEALSMGVDIFGRDLNPLAIRGARENLAHFGYDDPGLLSIGDMNHVSGHYDAAILDMPYNLCSVLPQDEKRAMLSSLRRFCETAVVVSSEELEFDLQACGFQIKDYGQVVKGSFVRNVWVCQS